MDTPFKLKKTCTCPNCGAEMVISCNQSTFFYVCSECGCSINAVEQNYDCENLCPNCNRILDNNECPYCGYDLGSDFD